MNTYRCKFGFDFDGVIADTIHLKRRLAKELHGVSIPEEKFKEYMVINEGYLTRDQYRDLMAVVCGDPVFGIQALELPGAVDTLRALQNRGDQIRLVTSRFGPEVDVIHAWLQERGLALECVAVGYGNDKAAAVEGFDIYVDDDLPKLMPLIGHIPKLFLFSQPHNKQVSVPGAIRRVDTWEELAHEAGFWRRTASVHTSL